MFDTSKINKSILNLSNYTEIEKHILKYAYDLIDKNYCKEIFSVEITDFNKDNIKDVIIKYINIDNNNVTRTMKLYQSTSIKMIPKGIYERQNMKLFGKALEGNNFPTIDKEISITKSINKTEENNIKSKIIKQTKTISKEKAKYVPPKVTRTEEKKTFNIYVPPTRKEGEAYIIPTYKVKIINIGYDFTKEDIINLCSSYGSVRDCYIPINNYGKNKGNNKGFAIVKFSSNIEVDNCIENVNNMRYEGMILKAEKNIRKN